MVVLLGRPILFFLFRCPHLAFLALLARPAYKITFGDPERVILCGFSRGAIAANAIGLHDDEIAKLWRGFVCYSHYDGVSSRWPFAGADAASARKRLGRLKGRPQLICSEFPHAGTRKHLENAGHAGDFTFLETGYRNHNDAWILRPSAARDTARNWLAEVIRKPAGK